MKLLIDNRKKEYRIDASENSYGRICSEIAKCLMDKSNTARCFEKPNSIVYVSNISQIKMSEEKKERKEIYKHSGFPGGLKCRNPKYFIQYGKTDDMIRNSVRRMLPKSKYFRRSTIERLIFIK